MRCNWSGGEAATQGEVLKGKQAAVVKSVPGVEDVDEGAPMFEFSEGAGITAVAEREPSTCGPWFVGCEKNLDRRFREPVEFRGRSQCTHGRAHGSQCRQVKTGAAGFVQVSADRAGLLDGRLLRLRS